MMPMTRLPSTGTTGDRRNKRTNEQTNGQAQHIEGMVLRGEQTSEDSMIKGAAHSGYRPARCEERWGRR